MGNGHMGTPPVDRQTDRHTGQKTLPSHNSLRWQAVIMHTSQILFEMYPIKFVHSNLSSK